MKAEELKERYKAELLPILKEKAEEALEIMNKEVNAGNNVDEIGYVLWAISSARNTIELM